MTIIVLPELRMSFADTSVLAQEIAQNLKHGRSFVRDAGGVPVLSDCTLVLEHPNGGELRLSAQVVMVLDQGAMRGVGLELRPFNATVADALDAFVSCAPPAATAPEEIAAAAAVSAPVPEPPLELIPEEPFADELIPEEPFADELIPAEAYAASLDDDDDLDDAADDGDDVDGGNDSEGDNDADEPDEGSDDEREGTSRSMRAPDVQQQARHEKLRKLSVAEQQKIARNGELSDRVMLERLYGKSVWDGLLHNPKLTVPEVARMARKGTMPRPMLELIIDNAGWIQAGAVRRALLTNPRVASEAVMKILRLTPKHELKAIAKGTAYSTLVRDAARKLLKL